MMVDSNTKQTTMERLCYLLCYLMGIICREFECFLQPVVLGVWMFVQSVVWVKVSKSSQYTWQIQSRSILVMAIMASMQHPFQLFFQRSMGHIVHNWPRSDLDGLVRVWPNTAVLEASCCAGIIGPSFWQDATRLPPFFSVSGFVPSSTDTWIILCKTRLDLI